MSLAKIRFALSKLRMFQEMKAKPLLFKQTLRLHCTLSHAYKSRVWPVNTLFQKVWSLNRGSVSSDLLIVLLDGTLVITGCQIKGLVCILKLLEFQGSDFKALTVVEIGFLVF